MDRRRLLGLGVAAGAAVLRPPRALAADPRPEPVVLDALLATERLTIAVAARVLASPHLGRRAAVPVRRILAAERRHARALEQALRRLGTGPSTPAATDPDTLDAALLVRHVHRSLGGLHSEKDCLDLLLDLEGIAEGALYDALPDLTEPAHQRLAAGLLASEAQHEGMLGLLREPKDFYRAAPYAYVEGIRP